MDQLCKSTMRCSRPTIRHPDRRTIETRIMPTGSAQRDHAQGDTAQDMPQGDLPMKFTDIFIRRPVLASVVSLMLLVIGLKAFYALPVLEYPKTENAVV